jgi:hypothetical protein
MKPVSHGRRCGAIVGLSFRGSPTAVSESHNSCNRAAPSNRHPHRGHLPTRTCSVIFKMKDFPDFFLDRLQQLKPFFSPNRDPTRYDFRKSAHIYSLSIGSRRARRPETFPKTAIYCHFGAAKPLRPLQPSPTCYPFLPHYEYQKLSASRTWFAPTRAIARDGGAG